MTTKKSTSATLRTLAAVFALLVAVPPGLIQAQSVESPDMQQTGPLWSPEQLDNLVAPVALYPDPLLSQVLAASTYPLEIVEAQQWLDQNENLSGADQIEAARQQNWAPSVQALVTFPDALDLLANDIRWTTDLGNAFLAQEGDVMSAVQRMRAEARANGRLDTTAQQVVTTETQQGQTIIQIVPADPEIIYVPVYSPTYVWGPPAWGYYYDPWYASGFTFGFGPAIHIGVYYPGWSGWGGWGWNCGWFGRGLFLNVNFFSRYRFRGVHYGGPRIHGHHGRTAWAHNPAHRWRTPYPNRSIASRYHSNRYRTSRPDARRHYATSFTGRGRSNAGPRTGARTNPNRPGTSRRSNSPATARPNGTRSKSSNGWQRFNGSSRPATATRSGSRNVTRSNRSGARTNDRGRTASSQPASRNRSAGASSSALHGRSSSAPRQRSTAERSSPAARQRSVAPRTDTRQGSSPARSSARRQSNTAARSSSAPRQRSTAARSSSAPRQGSSAARSSSATRQRSTAARPSSAPRQGSSAARSSRGASGSSGSRSAGRSGSAAGRPSPSGGRSNGNGGRRR